MDFCKNLFDRPLFGSRCFLAYAVHYNTLALGTGLNGLLARFLLRFVGSELRLQQVVLGPTDLRVGVLLNREALGGQELHHGVQPLVEFPGNLAQSHLCKQLGMIKVQTGGMANMATAFDVWLARHANHLRIHPAGPIYLIEPRWFD